MSGNATTNIIPTVESSPNKSATPLIVPPSEIKVVAPKMVELRKAVDPTSEVGALGGINSRNSDPEK